MPRAYIIDDEPKAIDTLAFLLNNECPEVKIIGTQTNPIEALKEVHALKPDLVFLDIQMPHLDGFEFIKSLGDVPFEIIFTTAFDQYAIKAFKFNALDYLLKPVSSEDLASAIENFKKRKSNANYKSPINNLRENLAEKNSSKLKLTIYGLDGTYFLKTENIIRLEADGNYTKIIMKNKKPILNARTLREFDEALEGHDFMRVHKSHLVNKFHVEAFMHNEYLQMSDESQVPIARRRKKEIRMLMNT
jgi:two-component system LytT family response regulator